MAHPSPEAALSFLRQQLFVRPGGEKDLRLQAYLQKRAAEGGGSVRLATAPIPLGIVSWDPNVSIR